MNLTIEQRKAKISEKNRIYREKTKVPKRAKSKGLRTAEQVLNGREPMYYRKSKNGCFVKRIIDEDIVDINISSQSFITDKEIYHQEHLTILREMV